jgi:hypothetical protein
MARPGSKLPPEEIVRRIERALAREGTHGWEDVRASLLKGNSRMFWNDHGVWITETVDTPRKRLLNVWIVAGELPGVMELQKDVQSHAAAMGCQSIVATARRGWKPVARAFGWKEQAMVITLAVENG